MRQSDANEKPTRGPEVRSSAIEGIWRKPLTRRCFLGAGLAVGAAALLSPYAAWGGVGGGGWGDIWSYAYPGNNFGYDSGWGYSSDGNVWLSVRCDATVGRMTELYLEISVKSYYANGGVWSPTWHTDYPDTHVWTYIMDGMSGDRLSSKRGFYDTTYDSSTYHGPYVTDVHRIERRTYDWTAYAVVNAWCDSPDNANGIDIIAEAGQIVPAHVLVDDASWHGRIVTMRSQAAPHLYMDVAGGSSADGANVWGWELLNTTNQHWIALRSSLGRTRFVPVHIGNVYTQLDVKGGVWDDDAPLQIYAGNSSKAQSFYVHDLGTGYHLIVPECSGCAVDLNGGGQANGTEISQWNCLSDWGNANQHWKIEEPVFRTRSGGPLTLSASGAAEPGAALRVAEDPDAACLPCNYPGTDGMFHQYEFWRFPADPGPDFSKWAGGVVVQAASTSSTYVVKDADADSFIACVVTAWTRWTTHVKYKGQAVTGSCKVLPALVDVEFFADGDPCFKTTVRQGSAFTVPQAAWDAAAKPGCEGVDGWYVDPACTAPYANGAALSQDSRLYGRNKVVVAYGTTDRSSAFFALRRCFADEDLTVLVQPTELVPSEWHGWHGGEIVFARPTPEAVYYDDDGRTHAVVAAGKVYATPNASGPGMARARVTKSATVYVDWDLPRYDGITVKPSL